MKYHLRDVLGDNLETVAKRAVLATIAKRAENHYRQKARCENWLNVEFHLAQNANTSATHLEIMQFEISTTKMASKMADFDRLGFEFPDYQDLIFLQKSYKQNVPTIWNELTKLMLRSTGPQRRQLDPKAGVSCCPRLLARCCLTAHAT